MMMPNMRVAGVLAMSIAMSGLVCSPSSAVECNKGFQKMGGEWIGTLLCQEEYMAEVAREHGMKVSAAEIRNSGNLRREVCQTIGSDIRVQPYCVQSGPRGPQY